MTKRNCLSFSVSLLLVVFLCASAHSEGPSGGSGSPAESRAMPAPASIVFNDPRAAAYWTSYDFLQQNLIELSSVWGVRQITASSRYEDDIKSWKGIASQIANLNQALRKLKARDSNFTLGFDVIHCSLAITPFAKPSLTEEVREEGQALVLWGTWLNAEPVSVDAITSYVTEHNPRNNRSARPESANEETKLDLGPWLGSVRFDIVGIRQFMKELGPNGLLMINVEGFFPGVPEKWFRALGLALGELDLALEESSLTNVTRLELEVREDEEALTYNPATRVLQYVVLSELGETDFIQRSRADRISKFLASHRLIINP